LQYYVGCSGWSYTSWQGPFYPPTIDNSAWVQSIIHNPRVSFTVNHTTFTGTARIIEQDKEPELTAGISKLMSTKYGWNEGLIVEL
jgi:hypothetical protein